MSPLVVHQFHLVVRQATRLEKEDAAFQDKYLAFFFFRLTWPVCSVSSLFMRYIKKNLKQVHGTGINAGSIISPLTFPRVGFDVYGGNQQRNDVPRLLGCFKEENAILGDFCEIANSWRICRSGRMYFSSFFISVLISSNT